MKKIIVTSLVFIVLVSCGYVPIHSVNSNFNFYIENIDLKGGDEDLSKFVKINLDRYSSKNGKKFNIEGTIDYSKNSISKNSAGDVQEYELTALATFTVNSELYKKYYEFKESSKFKKLGDKFEERQYEQTLKQSLAQSITSRLLMQLSKFDDN